MEFPDLGKHCAESFCRQIDFLPVRCDACKKVFCKDHFTYSQHNCPSSYKKDVQVPVCPLCNAPVPVQRGDLPDIAVSLHIDNDCKSDPAIQKRKIFTNRCGKKGCKTKEMIKVTCDSCGQNFCLKHRHPQDHSCQGPTGQAGPSRAGAAAIQRQQVAKSRNAAPSSVPATARIQPSHSTRSSLQGNMSEDEALAMALQASMSQTASQPAGSSSNQEELDRQMALALAASEQEQRHPNRTQRTVNSCNMS